MCKPQVIDGPNVVPTSRVYPLLLNQVYDPVNEVSARHYSAVFAFTY